MINGRIAHRLIKSRLGDSPDTRTTVNLSKFISHILKRLLHLTHVNNHHHVEILLNDGL